MYSRSLASALVCLCGTLACASAGTPSTIRSMSYLRSVPSSDHYIFTEARLMAGESLLDVLRRTHPRFLQSRDITVSSPRLGEDIIGVYLNGTFAGGLEILSTIPAHLVLSVERIRSADAANRYARKHRGHALEVSLLQR